MEIAENEIVKSADQRSARKFKTLLDITLDHHEAPEINIFHFFVVSISVFSIFAKYYLVRINRIGYYFLKYQLVIFLK